MKPMKPRNLWNQETYEITKPMKPQTNETKKTTQRLKPRNLWNHGSHESTEPTKHETNETKDVLNV